LDLAVFPMRLEASPARRKAAGGSSGGLRRSKNVIMKDMETMRPSRFLPLSATKSTFDQTKPI
jgi:hypothetical protein